MYMSKKLTLSVLLMISVVSSFIFTSQEVQAHFIVEDPKTGEEAYFHSTPEHSPIAGKESTISYDFSQADRNTKAYEYTLTAKRAKGKEVIVPTEITSNVVITDYVFPVQGLYELKLIASPKVEGAGKASVFIYNQRVSHGTEEKRKDFGNFEIGILAIVLGSVGIVFVFTFKDVIMKSNEK